jgi:DNA-binding NarL/FixJ family response regulator
MGGDDGLRSLEVIRRQAPRTHVLLIADDPSGEVLFHAVSMGVSGVLGCDTTRDELIHAVRRLGSGGTLPETPRPHDSFDSMRRRGAPRNGRRAGPGRSLNRQEVSVVRAIAEGHTDREIADHLAIPIATVKSHVRSILRKTGAVNRTGAITAAFRNRVLE